MFQLLLIIGIFFRLLLIPLPGFVADMAFWKGWGLAAADKGIIWLVKNTNYNYPPGFAYVLSVINKIYAQFFNPYDVNSYWAENNFAYLFLFKLLTIVSDIVVVLLIYKIIKFIKNDELGDKLAKITAILYFLNPASLYDGAAWGQVDQFGLMLLLGLVYMLLKDKVKIASAIFIIACMMKYQNIIFIPLFYLLIYKKYSFGYLITAIITSVATFLIIITPFWLYKETADLIKLLTINADYFPVYSLNSFNIWWILSGQNGMAVSDKNLIMGIINAKQIGLALFILAYFVGFFSLFRSKKEELTKKFILYCSLAVFAFFHLLTQSHERYLFPLVGLLGIYTVFLPKENIKNYFVFYLTFSFLFFLNIYITMYYNYPSQTIWPFDRNQTNNISLFLSVIQMIIFGYFIIKYILESIKKDYKYIIGFSIILLGAMFLLNLKYWMGIPISLTSLKPTRFSQDYLYPMYNKNLNTFTRPYAFDRLSSNYFFYDKGIATHANSTIEYGISNQFSKFKTDYGLDSEATANALVYYSIIGDDKVLFRSEKKSRFDYPNTVEVNVKGIKKLILKVDNATDSIYGAHADWLNPMLIK